MSQKQRRKCQNAIDGFLRERTGWLPARIALGVMAWFGFVNLYTVRVNLSVAIVAMVKRNTSSTTGEAACLTTLLENGTTILLDADESESSWNTTFDSVSQAEGDEDGKMLWDRTTQGLVLGSFSYGYALTQIIGGRVAELRGTRIVFGICILAGGISALLTPMAARSHYGVLIGLRALQGLFQGVAWPSMHACIARWIPPIERPRFIAIVFLAATLSSAMTMPLCGIIIASHGWPYVFYIFGILCVVWCCIWFTFMYDSPAEHPRISKSELNYIQTAITESGTSDHSRHSSLPWRGIFTSLPFYAILSGCIANSWAISLYSSQLPTYMNNVLGFSIKENGALSALPFLSRYLGGIVWSTLGSWLLTRKYITTVNNRRIFSVVGLWGPGLMLIGVIYAGCDRVATMVLLCLALFMNGAMTTSCFVNHTDIAPNFAGTLLGIDNTLASLIGACVPVVTGVITEGKQTLAAWQTVFWICVPIYILPEIFYLIYCSGDVQPWNNIKPKQSSTQGYKLADTEDPTEVSPRQS